MAMQFLDDGDYSGGVVRDNPSWQLPRGTVYDSLNMIYDVPGVARQRGGTTALFAGAQTALGDSIGFANSNDNSAHNELIIVDNTDGELYRVNQTTGVFTDIGGFLNAATFGRAFQHFGFICFPGILSASFNFLGAMITGGPSTYPGNFTNATATTTTANNATITLGGADVTTNIKVGGIITARPVAGYVYQGRVTAVLGAKDFQVWPTPKFTQALAPTNLNYFPSAPQLASACGTSFQNRFVLANCVDVASLATLNDRRLLYSALPTEDVAAGALTYTGAAVFLNYAAWTAQPNNFIDVPGSDPFVAVEPISDNELLILSARRPVIFRGSLVTQLSTTAQQVTFDVSELAKNAGCASDHSVQRTPRGVMWAGHDGVFIYSGSGVDPINVTDGKMGTYWRGLARSSTFAVHGSAYIRGHYLVTGTSGGSPFALLVDVQSKEYTFAPLTMTDIIGSVANPANPSQVFTCRYGSTSMTNGQVIRLESILDAFVAGSTKTDADGSAVTFSITSRVLDGDSSTQKIQQRMTVRYAAAMTAANITVTAQSRIDAADITSQAVRSLGVLSNTATLTVTAATNATPIVCTTATHGLQSDDFVDINGGTGNTHVNGRWRIAVLSSTTFSLVGSSGNGAYAASSARAKKVTEDDFQTNSLDQGQGVSFVIASSGTVNNFELHGLRIAFYEQRPVMSA